MRTKKNNAVPKNIKRGTGEFKPVDHVFPDQKLKELERANFLVELVQPKEILNIPRVKFPINNPNFPTNYPKGYDAELTERNTANDLLATPEKDNFIPNKDIFSDTDLDQLANKLDLQEEKRTLTSVAKLECKIAAATLKVLQANRELAEFKNALVKEYEAQNIKLNSVI